MARWFTALSVSLFVSHAARGIASAAETGRIEGGVKNAQTGEGIPGVTVTIEGKRVGTLTDEKGRFILSNLPEGTYPIVVRMIGYARERRLVRVIPAKATEVVQKFDLVKGPYSPAHGDFATAGAVAFTTLDRLERSAFHVEGGRFGTVRYLGMYQTPTPTSQSAYVAGEFYRTDGPFDRKQGFDRLNVYGKFRTELADGAALSFDASGFGAGWDASGQVPERAVERGLITRFGSVDPTEGGTTQRHHANLTYTSETGDRRFLSQVYFINYRFRLFSDFTFFANDPVNGDEIEQDDARRILGFRGEYALRQNAGNMPATTTLGVTYRADDAHVNLWHTTARKRIEPRVDALIHQQNVALFGQEEVVLSRYLRLQAGLRVDYFLFDVEDRLEDLTKLAGPRGSGYVQQTLVSPKLNVVLSPTPHLDIYLNAGTGFHSNDARDVVLHANDITLPRMISGEVGSRGRIGKRLNVGLAFWRYDLEREFVYNGDDGTTEESGPTRRVGADLEARLKLRPWLWGDWDLTLSRGRFKEAPKGEDQ